MKTFKNYIAEKYPEEIDEGFLKKAGAAALLAGALTIGGEGMPSVFRGNKPTASDTIRHRNINPLLSAAKRAGVPKNEWDKLKGTRVGEVVVSVNGRKVPLTKSEQNIVNSIKNVRKINNQ